MAPEIDFDPVPDNLAVLYAMEADGTEFGRPAMSFADFERLTRERNAFPDAFGYGAIHSFHTPDDRRYTFWLQLTLEKYRPRIIAQDAPADDFAVVTDDFSVLKLVDGPYLRARDGHDGYLQIRHPGCDTPLVLDFSDPARPVRIDNAEACPQPLVDRARAIMAYALDLIGKARAPIDPAKPVDPLDALRTAVDVFRDFDPPAAILSEYLLAYGQAVHVLVAFLLGIGRVDEALSLIREGVRVEVAAGNAPGADPEAIAPELTTLAGILSSLGHTAEGVDAQQAVVDMLIRFASAAAARPAYQLAVGEAVHNLIVRLLDDSRLSGIATLATQALSAYRKYAATPGADVVRVAADLSALSKQLTAAGRPHEAVLTQQAEVDVLVGFTPPAEKRLDYLLALAEGRHNLIARLIDDQRVEQGAALVAETIAAYRDYVGQPGADVMRVAGDLSALSAQLAAASRPHEAVLTQQALDAIV
ncbi:MAG: hypothetical protein ACJ8CB_07075 [Ktedonobacteraceae bacterium]